MNLVEVTRFGMALDTVVGNHAEYAAVLSGFAFADPEIQEYAAILSAVLDCVAVSARRARFARSFTSTRGWL